MHPSFQSLHSISRSSWLSRGCLHSVACPNLPLPQICLFSEPKILADRRYCESWTKSIRDDSATPRFSALTQTVCSGANAQNDQQKPVNPFASMGTTQPAQQSGLFTSSPSNAANPSGSSLFGAATSQPQQSGGLFGAAASQPQQSGSLFGASTSQPQQTSSLFGAPAPQPQQSSSLFGSSTSQPQQTSSLFGAATSQPQTGGLFGATNQQGTGSVLGGTTTTSAPSLFGQTRSLADAPPLGSGGFGSTQQAQVSQAGSLFGATQQNQNQNQTQQPGTSLFGGASNQSKPTLSLL